MIIYLNQRNRRVRLKCFTLRVAFRGTCNNRWIDSRYPVHNHYKRIKWGLNNASGKPTIDTGKGVTTNARGILNEETWRAVQIYAYNACILFNKSRFWYFWSSNRMFKHRFRTFDVERLMAKLNMNVSKNLLECV